MKGQMERKMFRLTLITERKLQRVLSTVGIQLLRCGLGALIVFSLAQAAELPKVTHYSLALHFLPREGKIAATAEMSIENTTSVEIKEISLLLYRLLEAESVTDKQGTLLPFTQDVVKFSDEPNLQVNQVKIHLDDGLAPGKTSIVRLTYCGTVFGYQEVMRYVRDRIDENYSLVRPDAFSYPMLCYPSWESLMEAYRSRFTYDIEATASKGYTIACGGMLKKKTAIDDSQLFSFQSRIPTWRMDIAMAKFEVIEDKKNSLVVYCLSGDESGAEIVLKAMERALGFFSESFGGLDDFQGFTVIEVPDGWGSQASDYYIVQTAAAFKDPSKLSEVYHEIAHMWNVRARPPLDRSRWFDEAFASYFEGLAIRAFKGEDAFQAYMERRRSRFISTAAEDRKNYKTPIAEYWKEELGQNSYTKGAWSLYILHRLIGDEAFKRTIKTLRSEFSQRPAGFDDFMKIAESVSGKNLKKYFDDWIFGAESSRLLAEKVSVNDILKRYE
jgi:hypothetical protein